MKAIKVDVENDANHSFGRDLELGTISFGSSLSTHHAKSIETILPRLHIFIATNVDTLTH